jgi:hypothetical protein
VDDWQPGDRVVLVHTNDPYTTLEPGDEGIVSGYTPITGRTGNGPPWFFRLDGRSRVNREVHAFTHGTVEAGG